MLLLETALLNRKKLLKKNTVYIKKLKYFEKKIHYRNKTSNILLIKFFSHSIINHLQTKKKTIAQSYETKSL